MKEINRELYLKKLVDSMNNGLIKIITGVRRSGKSYLLDPIFTQHLKSIGITDDHIIKLNLDDRANKVYLNPDNLSAYVKNKVKDNAKYYVIIDEIQLVDDFESVLNGFLYMRNLDIYVSGSNSKFLSSDIVTEFRGRSFEIRVFPLSFKEYVEATENNKKDAFDDYVRYGGMPLSVFMKTDNQKSQYLKELFELTYVKDIVERRKVERKDILEQLINVVSSSVGSLTSPTKLTNTFKSNGIKELSINTIIQYLKYLEDSFLIEKVNRYNIKGKKYIQTTTKYFFVDTGLRNARLNFRQQEENHLLENIVYIELIRRGYNVDVGVVEISEGNKKVQLEVDFVCNQSNKRYYLQIAQNLDTREKTIQETKSLRNIQDGFKKIIIVKNGTSPWITEEGVVVIDIIDFLMNDESLNIY